MVHIVTDSCSDLSKDLIEKYHIHIVPLIVNINGKDYKDGVEISMPELFQSVTFTQQLPKTSAPAIGDFLTLFNQLEGEIVCITISSRLSATFQNAELAAKETNSNRIRVIDSLNLSTGIGLLVLRAAELAKDGHSAAEIVADIQSRIPKIRTSFVVDTMDYLYKGGRCSAIQNLVASMLKIRPVIEVKPNGTLGVKDKTRGSRKKALQSMLDDFSKYANLLDPQRVFITHTGCDQDALFLVDEIRKLVSVQNIHITTAGATISSHCGPGTIGILFFVK